MSAFNGQANGQTNGKNGKHSPKAAAAHEEAACCCGIDPGECPCKCQDCLRANVSAMRDKRMLAIIDRLEKSGILVDDLAMLLWQRVEPIIEARIEQMAKEALNRMLRGLVLRSTIQDRPLNL